MSSVFFITGVPRSGTTLLAVLMNNHSAVHVGAEALTPSLLRTPEKVMVEARADIPQGSGKMMESLINALTKKERLNAFTAMDNTSGYYAQAEKFLVDTAKTKQKQVFGDKIPGMTGRLDLLLGTFPQAKVLLLIRDPRAVVNSLHTRQFYPVKLGAHVWRVLNLKALYYRSLYGEDRVLTVRYEQLVTNTQESLIAICRFLEIPFEENMLQLQDAEAVKRKNAYVSPEIDSSRLDNWKKELSIAHIKQVEALCADLMQDMGYPFQGTAPKLASLGAAGFIAEHLRLNWQTMKHGAYTGMKGQQLVPIKVPFRKRLKVSLSNSSKLFFSPQVQRAITFDKRGFLNDLP